MRRRAGVVLGAAAVAGAAALRPIVSDLMSKVSAGGGGPARWRAVTVNRPPEDVVVAELAPLAALGDRVEVVTRPAPGGRGTEIAARLRHGEPSGVGSLAARVTGHDPRIEVRSALRQAKQLLETGEVLQANDNTTTKTTLPGMVIDAVVSRAGGEGRL